MGGVMYSTARTRYQVVVFREIGGWRGGSRCKRLGGRVANDWSLLHTEITFDPIDNLDIVQIEFFLLDWM